MKEKVVGIDLGTGGTIRDHFDGERNVHPWSAESYR